MTSQNGAETRPDALDLWIAEVGEDYVTGLVDSTRKGVADGTIPVFRNKESFLEYLTNATLEKPK